MNIARPQIRRFALLSLAFVCLVATSCGTAGPKLHPVTGKVLFEDKPAEGATVVFHLTDGAPDAPKPAGTVGSDGSFKLNTYPHGEGAPEGEYTILVTWFDTPKNDNAEPKSRISLAYSQVAKSGLKASVKAGTNTLEPFRLTKQPR